MPTPVLNRKWHVPALLAVLTIIFYSKVIFTNHFMFPWDAATFFYPTFSFVHEQLRHFRMPWWDPNVMSGFPIIGDPEAQIFYPPNWLFVVLRPFRDLSYKLVEIQIVVHFFLAGLWMFYLARSFVRSTSAALIASVLFMFSGAMVVHTQHLASIGAMAYYPLIFLLARRGLLEKNIFFTVSAGICFGLQILVGHFQHSVYLGLMLFSYFAYEACFGEQRAKLWPRWIAFLAIIAGAGASLAMVQLIPTGELGQLSIRSYITYFDITSGNDRRFLFTLFLPNYTGGLLGVPEQMGLAFNYVFLTVPGCLLALLGLFETIRRRNFFWLSLIVLCTALSYGRNGWLGNIVYHTPVLNLFRNMGAFVDVANFALCLMAALGAESLSSGAPPQLLKKHFAAALTVLLLAATAVGYLLQLGQRIHGWYHMLAVFAVLTLVIAAALANKLNPSSARCAILGLIVFQFFFYNMNQTFNTEPQDPRKFMSRNSADFTTDVLRFLRTDKSGDFRIAAVAGADWSGSGPDIWLLPSIYGWNPVTVRRYADYINVFNTISNAAEPSGAVGYDFQSTMLDLLGTKYVIAIDDELKTALKQQTGKFEKVFSGNYDFMMVFRNKNDIPRARFYPQAYSLPDEDRLLALMSSRSFDGRRTLLFEKGDLSADGAKFAEELDTISLGPEKIVSAPEGQLSEELDCPAPVPVFEGWGSYGGNTIRFDFQGPTQPGRYLLSMRYSTIPAPVSPPPLEAEIETATGKQHSGPFAIASTYSAACFRTRNADLGSFDLVPGTNRLTIRSSGGSDIKIYSARLIQLPNPQPDNRTSSFDGYSVSPERISFTSHQSEDGFVLLNENYYPGWEARLDGKPTPILRSDGIFRVLRVPAGDHQLEFRFRPRYFALGATVSLITLGGYFFYAFSWKRRRTAMWAARLHEQNSMPEATS